MAGRLISVARSAYQYPLLIKQLLHAPMLQTPDQADRLSGSQTAHVYRPARPDRRLANYLKVSVFGPATPLA